MTEHRVTLGIIAEGRVTPPQLGAKLFIE